MYFIGIEGERKKESEIESVLAQRYKKWDKPELSFKGGALGIYSRLATSAIDGGYIKV